MRTLLRRIEQWYRRCLRMVIWKQWEHIKPKLVNLPKLGVSKFRAWAVGRNKEKSLAIANSFILNTTIISLPEKLNKRLHPAVRYLLYSAFSNKRTSLVQPHL